jgi:ribosomal protein S18 acetylase RimI-like enzyme
MDINIRLAKKTDFPRYIKLIQKTFQDTYVDESIGLRKEHFSKKIFNTPDSQKYFLSTLKVDKKQKCWLAFLNQRLIGSITITDKGDVYDLKSFYVMTRYQGKGIGGKLWRLALDFAKRKDITLEIYFHNTKTIEIYKKWGFKIDKERGEFYRHWPEWPEGLRAKTIFMRRKSKS